MFIKTNYCGIIFENEVRWSFAKGIFMNILVIDDEEFLAENLCQCLQQMEDIKSQFVTTIENAISVLSQNHFDIIISDLMLPNSHGEDWMLQVGKVKPGQKMIIISSYQIPKKVKASNNLKIIAYFEKPFDIEDIYRTIDRVRQQVDDNFKIMM